MVRKRKKIGGTAREESHDDLGAGVTERIEEEIREGTGQKMIVGVGSELARVVGSSRPTLKTRWDIPALSRGKPPRLARLSLVLHHPVRVQHFRRHHGWRRGGRVALHALRQFEGKVVMHHVNGVATARLSK